MKDISRKPHWPYIFLKKLRRFRGTDAMICMGMGASVM
jgi:hypothetical protein